MRPVDEGKMVTKSALATTNATAYHRLSFDKSGHDRANILVAIGSHDSATQGITELLISDSDTITSASSMTDIAALCSATETSTAASNVLPAAAVQALGGILTELQIDLRKRKRYIGVEVKSTAVAAGMPVAVIARLTDSKEASADSAAEKAGLDLAATNVSGCMAVING